MKIGFGGGCHWCTEAVFMALIGVYKVEQGWISSHGNQHTFSEAVIVYYNPIKIPLLALVEIHLRTHKSTSDHCMRKKYRSAIYTFSDHEIENVTYILKRLQTQFSSPLITQVLPYVNFKSSDEKYQNYYIKNPEKPFCKTYIQPKLNMLLNTYTKWVK